ncbi:MAG TPA: NRDE family protein [Blastocatellia bacterium]|nr:NRDE family protein [Blastocatellia bacterium]
MCTVSWMYNQEGYELFCNRDERHTRAAALPPRLHQFQDVSFISPIDPEGGGSWIGVNQFGVTLCLLNAYDAAQEKQVHQISRGRLLWYLMDCQSVLEISRRIERISMRVFRPLTLVALSPSEKVTVLHWNGNDLWINRNGDNERPLISSSYDLSGVQKSRRSEWQNLFSSNASELTLSNLRKFHVSHAPSRSPYSVCMHRHDARTVSFTCISVNNRSIQMSYLPTSPCRLRESLEAEEKVVAMPRRSGATNEIRSRKSQYPSGCTA